MIGIILSIASAALYAAAQPNELFNFGSPIIGLIALVPLYIHIIKSRTIRSSLLILAVFGASVTLFMHYWLGNFGSFAIWSLGGPVLAYTLMYTALAPMLHLMRRLPGALRPIGFSITWTAFEFLKGQGYLGFPWGYAAYSFSNVIPLIQITDLTGVYGLSFIIIYTNSLIAEFIARRNRQTTIGLLIAAVLFGLTTAYGYIRLGSLPPASAGISLLLVQQNTNPWQPDSLTGTIEILERLSEPAGNNNNIDLVVWSESSIPVPYKDHREKFGFIRNLSTPVLTGSPYFSRSLPGGQAWNAVILIDPENGDIIQRYGKRHLVPFAEHIPFHETGPAQWFFRNILGVYATWTPANEVVLFKIPLKASPQADISVGVPISFEGSFAGLNRDFVMNGADLLLNLTNNSWSQTASAQYQQFAVTRFRAVEARRPLALATISGLTSTVDISGAIIDSIPMFTEASLVSTIPLYPNMEITPYHRGNDTFAYIILIKSIILLGLALLLKSINPYQEDHNNPFGDRQNFPDYPAPDDQ
ncbi:apolipoprotein N-acyltransferase [Spirochaeta dissipatitropha]